MAGSTVQAGDLLSAVPSDSVGFVYVKQVSELGAKLTTLRNAAFPAGRWQLDTAELETVLGLSPGTVDPDRPLIVIFDDLIELAQLFKGPGVAPASATCPIIGFHPKSTKNFVLRNGNGPSVGMYEGPFGRFAAVQVEDMAFVSTPIKRRALRRVGRALRRDAERMLLSDATSASARASDLTFHLALDDLRNSYMQQLTAVAALVKFNALSQVNDAARYGEALALVNWMADGALDAVRQMNGFTLAVALGDNQLTLRHVHTFEDGGWMIDYLGAVKKHNFDRFSIFKNEPFLMAASVDWGVSAPRSFSSKLIETALSKNNSVLTAAECDQLRADTKAICERSQGQEFRVAVSEDGQAAIQILGAAVVADVQRYYTAHRNVQDFTNRLMATVVPGSGNLSDGETVRRDGRDVYQVSFSGDHVPDDVRRNIELVYGKDAIYQETVVLPSHVVYAVGALANGFVGLCDSNHANALRSNEAVQQAVGRMPSEANVVAMVDLSRFADAIPRFVRASQTATLADSRLLDMAAVGTAAPDAVGPLLCWSMTAKPQDLVGEFVISFRDLRETTQIAANIAMALNPPKSDTAPKDER